MLELRNKPMLRYVKTASRRLPSALDRELERPALDEPRLGHAGGTSGTGRRGAAGREDVDGESGGGEG
eukprot:scaffold11235_cov98-Isochrysis_galbana.AAC.1